jgi:hypothetical protein
MKSEHWVSRSRSGNTNTPLLQGWRPQQKSGIGSQRCTSDINSQSTEGAGASGMCAEGQQAGRRTSAASSRA